MRMVPAGLQAKLDSGVTTLARCWIVTRRDDVVQGFTDHDEDITVNSVTCRAGTGLFGSEATAQLGLAIQGAEISGALADDSLTEADLAAGRYDAAVVEVRLVDWSEPSLKVLLHTGSLGEVRREGGMFTAELRSRAHQLAETRGRLYTATCSADLGDARCNVNLGDPDLSRDGSVVELTGASSFRAGGIGGVTPGWFTAGKLAFNSGANAGLAVEVKTHRVDSGEAFLELWQLMPETIAPGDTFTVTAGCDKRFATCRDRFSNSINFRGFPHIPGNDFVLRYPTPGEPGNDGATQNAE